MALSVGDRLGPYEILAPIGAGGMGEVYRARDTKLKREVALKVLPNSFAGDPERMARFQREAEVLAALNHPNIAQIYGIEDRALVMELVEGQTLQGPLPLDTALNYAKQIADALEAAHDKGIIHRDLKPANIMITPAGVIKVLDFGLAAVAQSSDPSSPANSPTLTISPTRAGMILGTAGYMSPEQARGKAVDKRADIWAFGVVLYEALTGQRLFEGETVSDTLAAVLKTEPDLNRVPVKVRGLLRSCLEKDPKQRLQAIGDWKLMLAEDTPVATAPSTSRLGWVAWIAAAVLAVVAVVALWAPWRKPPAAPDVKRYQIPMKGSVAGAPFLEFAVSPDGRNLAYITRGAATQLWIQSLDSIEPRALFALENAGGAPIFPFWSPDSQSIAFVSGTKLRKVNISGGTPQTICDVNRTNITAGSWNRDGVMLVSSGGTILRVSDAGGSLSPVVAPGTEKRFGNFPFFLPDGRHFLYYGSPASATGGAIFIGSLDAKPEAQDAKAVFPADTAPLFALDPEQTAESGLGHILFRRVGALFSQPFDARRLRLTGEAVAVSDQIGSFINLPAYSVSANGVLIYHTGLSFRANSQLTWFDRQGHTTGTLGEPNSYAPATARVSPNGDRVALTLVDYSKSIADIWVSNVSHGPPTRLTFGPGYSCCAVWSPDSSRIAFTRRDGRLYRKNADGTGEEEPLPVSGQNPTPTNWSHDGRYLLYTMPNAQGSVDIWVLPLEGGSKPFPFLSTPAEERDGVFSPDGRWVAYSSNETGARQIYVRPFSSSVRGKWLVSNGTSLGAPSWRQDGKELYYVAADGSVMAVPISANQGFQAGEPKTLFKLPSDSVLNAVTPDGNRFLVGDAANSTQPSSLPPFTVVLNWQAGLKK